MPRLRNRRRPPEPGSGRWVARVPEGTDPMGGAYAGVIARLAPEADPADVVAAVQFARSQGLEIAVRGGGHSLPGFSTVDGGLVIDLSPMRAVAVDVPGRRAVVGGGATWADVDQATQAAGLAVTGGLVSTNQLYPRKLSGGLAGIAWASSIEKYSVSRPTCAVTFEWTMSTYAGAGKNCCSGRVSPVRCSIVTRRWCEGCGTTRCIRAASLSRSA